MSKKKLFDVNFNVYSSIVVEANDEDEAIDKVTNDDIKERVLEAIANGGVDFGTIEEVGEVE